MYQIHPKSHRQRDNIMNLFNIIKAAGINIDPDECKLHMAVHNKTEDPMDVYLDNNFKEWQEKQTKKNFERKYIVALIQFHENKKNWLFAGLYESISVKRRHNHPSKYQYKTKLVDDLNILDGRLIINFDKKSRASYLNAERWTENLEIAYLTKKKHTIQSFPGSRNVLISKRKLDFIISQSIDSWRGALEDRKGIYLITDTKTGKLYVGKADGEEGLWQRWTTYSKTGHGGNTGLINILKEYGENYSQNFQFSILETLDEKSDESINSREEYWKQVLKSKDFGYNDN